ncbi:hypothetical protein N7468_005143 [Penicillium chermesinum]|uniref:Uncharacterized protein n=1 Tax=Penicillium chermesinum TaxID=63820 RepID=A0A9W9NYQ9_9EURO|nr:uncharacterized protein N7468_005143 [Penicillium chermesinum]KAJ5232187.1 hypothetical protein N7468_005143 [Penicillium chermesinum]KAJ6171850.1 hypothetical protein N7470_000917 [Penicillium chermesinum]
MSAKAAKKAAKRAENASDFYMGDDVSEEEKKPRPKTSSKIPQQPFRFLDLPSEIRLQIYHLVLFTPTRKTARQNRGTVGASAKKSKPLAPASVRIALFLVSRRIHDEASHYFFSTQIFRVFPVQDFSRRPTVRSLPRRHRSLVTTIELILGNSWTNPPKSWTVDKSLGLQDMVLTRTLKVFVECDPSQPIFEGFRISREYYTEFSGRLMREILEQLPALEHVEFDAYPSVKKDGSLMSRLLLETQKAGLGVFWGPERGWTDFGTKGFEELEQEAEEAAKEAAKNEALDKFRSRFGSGSVDELNKSFQSVSLGGF